MENKLNRRLIKKLIRRRMKLKKRKRLRNYLSDFLVRHKKNLITYTAFLILLTITYFYASANNPTNTPNIKDLATITEPLTSEKAINKLQELIKSVLNLELKQQEMDRDIKMLLEMFKNLQATRKLYYDHVNIIKAKKLIENALQMYDADKLGIMDYALETLGGRILSTPQTVPAPINAFRLFGFVMFVERSRPTELIQADVNPGKCFAFSSTRGRIQIELSRTICISAVTMEHTHIFFVGNEIKSAPRNFTVYGFQNLNNVILVELGTFAYTIKGPPRQTFVIPQDRQSTAYKFVELAILNNHGKKNFTCVYRFRVHGRSC